jgi:acyl CoA:acetate/3-ketoacid CoA transferase alpha subunit
MKEKLFTLETAVSQFIRNGDVIAIGGVGRNRSPMAEM